MFLSDPVTIWFRRRSSGSCEDALTPVFARPKLADSTDEEDEVREDECTESHEEGGDVVFVSSPTSIDSPIVTSPCLPFRRGSFSRSTKEKNSKRASGEKSKKQSKSATTGEEGGAKKKGPRMLWRSKSSCADSKVSQALKSVRGGRWRSKDNAEALIDHGQSGITPGDIDVPTSPHRHVIRQHTTPTILLVNGDSPHRLERSLSNIGDFSSSSPLNDSPTSPNVCTNLSISPPPNNPRYFRSPSLSVSPPHSSSPLSPSPPTLRSSSMYAQSLSPPIERHHYHHQHHSQVSPPPVQGSSPFRRKSTSNFQHRSTCFDFEYIPDKLRSLQEDWRAHKQHRRRLARLSRQEAKVTTVPPAEGQGQQRLSRSSSRSWSRSPRAVSPMPLSCEDYVLYLYSLEGK
ncbi:hypothetical protein ElyMa_003583800 [Elysia marginata]|uniref:Uncharacterized protein n=1 Tax=Elysia marginata TaxID=1093978 RepID=A0AAV4ENM2_9GAST|nr:hypothetical protein ElyMa_003583800 [Elysia marginata]